MAVISKGQTFATGDQVTALKLNNLADNATFASGAVDNVSTQLSSGAIIVKDSGVTTAKLNDDAVTTAKIANNNVTTAKIADANVTTAKIADANVTFAKLTDVIDDDTMATASATKLATSESIKAYVDEYLLKYSGETGTLSIPVAYQYSDLNLSSTVGSNRALVVLEVVNSSAFISIFFRTKGSSAIPRGDLNYGGWGASGVTTYPGNYGGTITVITDENGVVEYTGSNVSTGISYTIQAYQKLA